MLKRIISGGQTGADRGGLDAAIALGIPHGGWCPRGRRAEDGTIPLTYSLRPTASAAYAVRTRRNVRAADGTVLFTRGVPTGGSRLTAEFARELGKPLLQFDLHALGARPTEACSRLRSWLAGHRIRTLNVAGSRESMAPGIHAAVARFLIQALSTVGFATEPERVGAEPFGRLPVAAESDLGPGSKRRRGR
jgi:hypothetical protein